MSDAICRLATGGGFATRALFTDSEEAVFNATRPILLNGIGGFVQRGDLIDRSLTLSLRAIDDGERRERAAVMTAVEAAAPKLFGAALDALSLGLRLMPATRLERLPRMADFARFATAAETAFTEPGGFMAAWESSRMASLPDDLEADPVAGAVVQLMEGRGYAWSGTATMLLKALDPDQSRRDLPRAANALSQAVTRSIPLIARAGFHVTFVRGEGRDRSRIITIEATPAAKARK
jgi:hypothetical protein